MIKNFSFAYAILIISALTLGGCKKGKDGAPGKDGSTNVKTITFPVTSWTDNSSYWFKQLSVSDLTADNINTAAVMVYWGTTSNNWTALPYTHVASTNYFMNFSTSINMVEVKWIYNGIGSGSSPNSVLGGTVQIKVVVIPPSARKANPDLDMNNYEEVRKAFHLRD